MNDCVRCGYCCKKVQCSLSVDIFGYVKICPLLEVEDGIYSCGLITKSDEVMKKEYEKALSIGAGCSSSSRKEMLEKIKDDNI